MDYWYRSAWYWEREKERQLVLSGSVGNWVWEAENEELKLEQENNFTISRGITALEGFADFLAAAILCIQKLQLGGKYNEWK